MEKDEIDILEYKDQKDGLNLRQLRFCQEYVYGDFRGNGTQAAKIAGYSDKTAGSYGSENLKKPNIQKCMLEFERKIYKRYRNNFDEKVNTVDEMIQRCVDDDDRRNFAHLMELSNKMLGYNAAERRHLTGAVGFAEVSAQEGESTDDFCTRIIRGPH